VFLPILHTHYLLFLMPTPFQLQTFDEYQQAYRESVENPEQFWNGIAQQFTWHKPWEKTLEWNFEEPRVEWFRGGQLNITENCLDRHLATQPDKTALIWEANEPDTPSQKITYRELHERVCKLANALKAQGVGKGDRVCIYMPMVPELLVSVLACARIGAVHSVVFAGFSASSLSDRINDSACRLVLTSDGMYRGQKAQAVKQVVDEALQNAPSVERVLVVKRTGMEVTMQEGRDLWMEDALKEVSEDCPATVMDAEDMLFILYTSGSTGKPKGVVHTCGGYMVFAEYSFRNVFQPRENDVYWCTADVGWVTGHTYLVYGPLLAGATTVMFEGIPTYPDPGRFWDVIDKHQVTLFYTAPTAIRSLMAAGTEHVTQRSLASLRVLGSVGEPINEEAWHWYDEHVGKKRCPIVDTWWQTETGGIMISALAGVSPQKPTFAGLPLPGIQPILVDARGMEIRENGTEGYLCVKFPWPSMIRTTYGDHERCRQTYFATYQGRYFTGDGARRDKDGMYRIIGRVDDVINVSGHRFGTAEIENAINECPHVVESAVVGYPHDIKGQGIYAFVICEPDLGGASEEQMRTDILKTVTRVIGPIAKPDKIQLVPGLPKTRSGKIMRRILRKIAEGDVSNLGDTSTLLDPEVVEKIKAGAV
jgi:acetyl-CoA synthetase